MMTSQPTALAAQTAKPAGTVLEIEGLQISSPLRTLVADCTLAVGPGEAVGLVGESGSGKTLTARAVAGLLPEDFTIGGRIQLMGEDMSHQASPALRSLRAQKMGMVFQTPRAHLNPLRTIGDFLTEAMVTVGGRTRAQADSRALELLDEVGIDHPGRRLRQHPSDLSGGLLQRVMIAATLAMDPALLLADEITTALDVTTQEEVMAVINDLRRHRELSVLFITHDLALAGAVCDRVAVMQQGRTIETLEAGRMREDARAEYTKILMSASLNQTAPEPIVPEADRQAGPEDASLLSVAQLRKTFRVRKDRGGGHEIFTALDGIDLQLPTGGCLGIVGESGSGKSTAARIICGLESADSGTIQVGDQDWSRPARGGRARRNRAKIAQMVFQDPYQSLDPRQSVRACLTEAITVHRSDRSASAIEARIVELLGQVRLDESLIDARPRALSGGQRQRVAIARALAADPDILILDEAVSALDRTTQVEILTLLDSIRRRTGVALLMITHDLTIIRRLCEEVVVMRSGAVEERGSAAEILETPRSEYTKRLIDSIPRPGWTPCRRGGVGRMTSERA